MATVLDTASVRVQASGTIRSALDLGAATAPGGFTQQEIFTNGTGANQAGNLFHDQRTTNDTGESLDLAGGLNNALNEVITFTAIKALVIRAAATNTLNVLVGGAAANAFVNWVASATDIIAIRPGGTLALIAPDATGYAVTAGTGDLLKIAASAAGNVTYDIFILGEV